jgi:hypothetical protein
MRLQSLKFTDTRRLAKDFLARANSGPQICRRIFFMTTREKAHALLDEMSDAELDEIVRQLEVRHEKRDEPQMAELPEAWRRLPSGAPAPNWVAALDEVRRGR